MDKQTKIEQLRLAAKILEEGLEWEVATEEGWIKPSHNVINYAGYHPIRIKPAFSLSPPPPGMKWHREDEWTEDMLPQGWRPLVAGELLQIGDEVWNTIWVAYDPFEAPHTSYWLLSRTTRPLTFTHEGHEWTWHRPGDPMPCDGRREVNVLILYHGKYNVAGRLIGKDWDWESGRIIGWRYADAETFTEEPVWIEWHGGECPLKDDEAEEWELKFRSGVVMTKPFLPPCYLGWQHTGDPADIIAYRILKWRQPKPKVPLGPEDILPGSVFRGSANQPHEWFGALCVDETGVYYQWGSGSSFVHFEHMMNAEWLINRSIPLTGKWNPYAWEACEK